MERCVVGFKPVGKPITFFKMENSLEEFKRLLGGEITNKYYEGFTIVHRKDDTYLRPNIYIEGTFLKLGYSIKGPFLVLNSCNDGKCYYSLTKDQAIKLRTLFIRKSYNYKNCDEYGNLLSRRELKRRRQLERNNSSQNNNSIQLENNLNKQKDINALVSQVVNEQINSCSANNNDSTVTSDTFNDRLIDLIFNIQVLLFRFIEENKKNK